MSNISGNETKLVHTILEALKKMPKIFKYISIIAAALAASAFVLGLTSCGNSSKITISSTPNDISIAVTQNSHDSTAVSVNVNPTLRFYGSENETSPK